MTTRTRPFVLPFLLSLLPAALVAQDPTGEHHVTQLDGSAVRDGVDIKVEVRETDPGVYTGTVSLSVGGGPWQESANETMTLWPVLDGLYYWRNARGSTGILEWNAARGQWVTTVLTGSNAGTQRAWS